MSQHEKTYSIRTVYHQLFQFHIAVAQFNVLLKVAACETKIDFEIYF